MTTRMLGTIGQPFCGKCCGVKRRSDHAALKRRARQIEKRAVRRLIMEEEGK
jgi:hypothetical protein